MSSTGCQPARGYLISSASGAVRTPSPPADKNAAWAHPRRPARKWGPHVIHSDHSISRVRPPIYIPKTIFFFPRKEREKGGDSSPPPSLSPGSPYPVVETLPPPRRRRRWPPQHRQKGHRTYPRTLPPSRCRRPATDRSIGRRLGSRRRIRIGRRHVEGQGLRRRQRAAPQGVLGLRGAHRSMGVSPLLSTPPFPRARNNPSSSFGFAAVVRACPCGELFGRLVRLGSV